MNKVQPKILFTCGREPAYPRNDFLFSTLDRRFRVEKFTSSSRRIFWRYAKIAAHYPSLLWKKTDLIVAGFLGQPLLPLLRAFTRQPVLFDPFVSMYDTLVNDRLTAAPGSPAAKLSFLLDQWALQHADLILADTRAHAAYFQEMFGIPPEKIRVLMVGADEQVFFPRDPDIGRTTGVDSQTVLYYSSYLPLHGTETVIRAARIIQDSMPEVRFHLIGEGIEYERIRKLADEIALRNTVFSASVPLAQLPQNIAEAAVCLGGHFGKSEKARRVIAGKTYQCLAMGKATIVGDNPANRELLTHGKDAWFCDMDNPQSLANAVRMLIDDPALRATLGQAGRQTFLEKASYAVLGKQLIKIVEEMVAK